MRPTIIDADTGRTLWRVTDCATHCGISDATWRSYARKNMPPPPRRPPRPPHPTLGRPSRPKLARRAARCGERGCGGVVGG